MVSELALKIISFLLFIGLLYIGYIIFFNIKKRNWSKQTIPLCPKCGSPRHTMGSSWLASFFPKYQCTDCGFEGAFPEITTEQFVAFMKKKTAKKKSIPTQK